MSSAPPPPPPGWYTVDGERKYWDGHQWAQPPATPEQSPPPVVVPAKPAARSGCGTGCLVVLIVLVVAIVLGLIAVGTHPSAQSQADDDQFTAQVTCEEVVKKNLKAPSTAQFSDETSTGSDPILVEGEVDSENSFGAKLRAHFTCTATGSGDDLVAHLTSLDQQ